MKNKLKDIKTQVLVVGSGAAGISAAIAAARHGAKTLLIEYHGFLGGISATLPWLGFHDRDYRQVVKGFADEVVKKMHAQGASSDYVYDPKCSSLVSIDSHSWKIMAIKL
ncbi:MAG: FAD-dependent oxidoreductase, partial [Candidatus Heimdallarchaeota archaeon]|nr:FAD-dependent oxidoreductase [Candidatus Heimdallarchaeota archaeon]